MSTPVEKIKERVTIEDVVSSYVKLEKAGKNFRARCPFHNEKTPSFYVTPDRGTFYCFGCGAKGDIFSFVEQFEGLDFMGSLKLLAEKAGIDLAAERAKGGWGAKADTAAKSEKERLYAVMEASAKFFEENLMLGSGPYAAAAAEAREYVKKRGITEETAKDFRLGFAPKEWRLLYTYLREQKFTDAEIEKAGLAKRPEPQLGMASPGGSNVGSGSSSVIQEKNPYDRFRDRIMFPINDSSGRVIAFSGRILHDDEKSAKYLNSPDTPLYTKSTVLYGIDKAKQDIRLKNYSIMVEGQMDLVLSHQAGIKNTVAVSGTALADTVMSRDNVVNNLGIVRRLSSNVILAFDSDSAGRKAAMRSAQIALSLGMDVKIAQIVGGKDPADMVLEDPESWKSVLRAAKPIVEFQLDAVMAEVEADKLDARKIPPLLRERVLPFIVAVEGTMEKAHYVKMIHERTRLDFDAIRIDLKDVERKLAAEKAAAAAPGKAQNRPSDAPNGASGQGTANNAILSGTAQVTRLDMISRKLFGLLAYLTREKSPLDIDGIRAAIRRLAGDERYDNLIRSIGPFEEELALEAEVFFGSDTGPAIQKNIDELLLNFEEDIIKQEMSAAMAQLATLEKKKGDSTAEEHAHELMKKCQVLGIRLSELAHKRNL
ncbi:MAG: dnaG [Candidatus Taylorbacteria bacterium]|nr:dnaG [Candidatus Taylorbacteria bacterium]